MGQLITSLENPINAGLQAILALIIRQHLLMMQLKLRLDGTGNLTGNRAINMMGQPEHLTQHGLHPLTKTPTGKPPTIHATLNLELSGAYPPILSGTMWTIVAAGPTGTSLGTQA